MKNLYGGHILATDAPMQSSIPDIYICKKSLCWEKGNLAGMRLYAKTNEAFAHDFDFWNGGIKISVITITEYLLFKCPAD